MRPRSEEADDAGAKGAEDEGAGGHRDAIAAEALRLDETLSLENAALALLAANAAGGSR